MKTLLFLFNVALLAALGFTGFYTCRFAYWSGMTGWSFLSQAWPYLLWNVIVMLAFVIEGECLSNMYQDYDKPKAMRCIHFSKMMLLIMAIWAAVWFWWLY